MPVSCYFSSNSGVLEFEAFLERLGRGLRDLWVRGDFHARLLKWLKRVRSANRKGRCPDEWIASRGLIVANTGGSPGRVATGFIVMRGVVTDHYMH